MIKFKELIYRFWYVSPFKIEIKESDSTKMKDELIQKFEDHIEKNYNNGIWKSYIEIEEITEIDIHDVIKGVDNCYDFCQNTKGKFTTRKMYEKHTTFWQKFLNEFLGYIQ